MTVNLYQLGMKAWDPEVVNAIKEQLHSMGIHSLDFQIERALYQIGSSVLDGKEAAGIMKSLADSIIGVFSDQIFLVLPPEDVQLFEENQFSQTIQSKFAYLLDDLREAGKCLALERSTASVFHLMRVMEVGVQELAKKLRIRKKVVNQKSWGVILNHINGAIKALPERTNPQKKKKDKYRQLSAYLDNVKIAWRNNTMHPHSVYTQKQAIEILSQTKTFMSYLVDEIV